MIINWDCRFSEFEKEPIGAASLAQVHKGKLKDGTRVAIKIQYPSLEYLYKSDIRAIEIVFRSIKAVRFKILIIWHILMSP